MKIRAPHDGTDPLVTIPVVNAVAHRPEHFLGLSPRSIYDRELDYVWIFLVRLGVEDNDLEDLSQEVFAKFFERWEAFDKTRPLRPWLLGIAYHVARDFRRANHRGTELVTDPDDLATTAASGPAADEALMAAQQHQLVRRALLAIPLDRRAVFIMHELNEETVPAIAELLSLPVNTAYSRLRLARKEFIGAIQEIGKTDAG